MFNESFTVKTITQTITNDENVSYNIVAEYGIEKYIDLNVVKWHDRFDALLGSEDFQNQGAKIDYENHTLELNKVKIPFYFELNPSTFKPFSQKASKYIKVSVNIEEGQVLIHETSIDNIVIPESIAFAKDGYCQLPFEEEREVNINFHHPLDVEPVVNYEFQALRPETSRMDISNLVRTEHLNPEDKRELLTLCTKYKDVFFYEHSDLTFTNAVKHEIRLRITTQYSLNPPNIHIT
ncbi:hypothetical protein Trydic_g18697 [Trypoxylus dichotomus]